MLCNNEETGCNESRLVCNCVNKNCLTLWNRRFDHMQLNGKIFSVALNLLTVIIKMNVWSTLVTKSGNFHTQKKENLE